MTTRKPVLVLATLGVFAAAVVVTYVATSRIGSSNSRSEPAAITESRVTSFAPSRVGGESEVELTPALGSKTVRIPTVTPANHAESRSSKNSLDCITGKVVDDADVPIQGASVFRIGASGDVAESVRSSTEGEFTLGIGDRPDDVLVARSVGFCEASLRVDAIDRTVPVVLRLQRGGFLRGRVVLPDNSIPARSISVLAWREDRPMPTQELVSGTAGGHPYYRLVAAANDGTFEISNVTLGARYNLAAGGEGYAAYRSDRELQPRQAVANGPSITLEVAPLYVVAVKLVGVGGAPLRCSPLLEKPEGMPVRIPHELEYTSGRFPGSWMSGLQALKNSSVAPHSFRALYMSKADVPRIGPIVATFAEPGYEPKKVDLWAIRFDPGSDAEQIVELREAAAGFGNLSITLSCPLTEEARAQLHGIKFDPSEPIATVQLHPSESPNFEGDLTCRIPMPGTDVVYLKGVPSGTYEAQLTSEASPTRSFVSATALRSLPTVTSS